MVLVIFSWGVCDCLMGTRGDVRKVLRAIDVWNLKQKQKEKTKAIPHILNS
jgi:hypothetical protein